MAKLDEKLKKKEDPSPEEVRAKLLSNEEDPKEESSRDKISSEYKAERDRIRWSALADKLARGFGRIGAGVGGLKKGVDLSKVDFGPETDYGAERTELLNKYSTDLKDVGAQEAIKRKEAKEEAEAKRLADKEEKEDKRYLETQDYKRGRDSQSDLDKATKEATRLRERDEKLSTEKEKDVRSRTVPGVGVALTAQGAKKIQESQQIKASLDRSLKELIEIRGSSGPLGTPGGEIMDRDKVLRANNLSSAIILQYKNLAGLGVLSKSDEKILDRLVPADPTEFKPADILNSVIAAFGGKEDKLKSGETLTDDSIYNNLIRFRNDVNDDYRETVKTRLESSFDEVTAYYGNNKTPIKLIKGSDTYKKALKDPKIKIVTE